MEFLGPIMYKKKIYILSETFVNNFSFIQKSLIFLNIFCFFLNGGGGEALLTAIEQIK